MLFLSGVPKISWLVCGSALNSSLSGCMRGSVLTFLSLKTTCFYPKFMVVHRGLCRNSYMACIRNDCLFQSPSIRSYITDVLYNPRLSFCTDTDRIMSECNMDEEHFFECLNVPSATKNLDHRIKLLNTIGWMIGSSLTQYQVVMVQQRNLQSTYFRRLLIR